MASGNNTVSSSLPIKVDTVKMKEASEQIFNLSRSMNDLSGRLNSTAERGIYKFAGGEQVKSAIHLYGNKMDLYNGYTAAMSSTLKEIAERYEKAETRNMGQQSSSAASPAGSGGNGGGGARGEGGSVGSRGETQTDNSFSQYVNFIKSWLSYFDGNGNPFAGFGKTGLSYLESLISFFTGDMRGLTGAKDWFDLGDNSIGLWSGLYDYLKDFYNGAGGLFNEANQRVMGGIGIIGDLYGLASKVFGAADNINNAGRIGPAGIIGEILGGGGSLVDIWSDVVKISHIGDKAANITTKTGLYSPLSFYTTIAKSYTDAIAQAFKSYDKYTADGKFDLGDIANTGMDLSIKGLYSMVDSLSFGLLSEKTTGVSAEQVAQVYKNFGQTIGNNAGNYILSHPELKRTYDGAWGIGKVGITFYSAIASIFS